MSDNFPARRDPGAPRQLSPSTREVRRLDATTRAHAQRVRSVAFVTHTALLAAAGISATQRQLEELHPSAAMRLAAIADAGVAALQAEVLGMAVPLP